MGSRLDVTTSWRAVAATATGSSHRDRDEDGQDAVAVATLDDGTLVLAVADGAGSADLAAEGSSSAVRAAVDAVDAGACLPEAFEAAALSLGDEPERRATTLLVAALRDDRVEIAQVGDGFVVVRHDGGYDVVCPAPAREYLNETTFLSSANWRDDLRVTSLDGIDGVGVMTDGLQLVAVELATNTPFAGFFDPLFSWAASDSASGEELRAFLASPRLAERTDDDVTLALAIRTP